MLAWGGVRNETFDTAEWGMGMKLKGTDLLYGEVTLRMMGMGEWE